MSIEIDSQVRNAQTRDCYAPGEWINLATMPEYEANGVERMFGQVVGFPEARERAGTTLLYLDGLWATDPKKFVIYDQPQIDSKDLHAFRYDEIERGRGKLPLIVSKSLVREAIQAKLESLCLAIEILDK